MSKFEEAKAEFIQQWGTLGNSWGMNKTFAQVHGLLMIADKPMSTDDVMDYLNISRGNAHSNLKELQAWGLVKVAHVPGDRKDYFVGLKDTWEMFYFIVKERQRREIDPMKRILEECIEKTKGLKTDEAKAFNNQLKGVDGFINSGCKALERLLGAQKNNMFKWILAKLTK